MKFKRSHLHYFRKLKNKLPNVILIMCPIDNLRTFFHSHWFSSASYYDLPLLPCKIPNKSLTSRIQWNLTPSESFSLLWYWKDDEDPSFIELGKSYDTSITETNSHKVWLCLVIQGMSYFDFNWWWLIVGWKL